MGRHRKYNTPEEIAEANRVKAQRYYEKNREKVKKRNLKAYYDSKDNS
jgi:hypothetical protein